MTEDSPRSEVRGPKSEVRGAKQESCVRQVLQIGLVIPVSGSSLICLLRALRVWLFGNIPPPPGGAARCVKLTHLPSVPL